MEGLPKKSWSAAVLWLCLDVGLRLLHPFMPFVTEELWQRLPRKEADLQTTPSIMIAPYPAPTESWKNLGVEAEMALLNAIIGTARSARVAQGLTPKQKTPLIVLCHDESVAATVAKGVMSISTLASCDSVRAILDKTELPSNLESHAVNDGARCTIHIPSQ
ncbi:hypothetical protein CYMTET_2792 [Cymbomonas tetramitiformis]|uniref:valine--tRNA ligase n=1 Tax=Cymbomonas tetramitiformis TaxID=36881 RepID=A0AAE0LLN3_9CHLO|nr:hypothetical protein CYMTET_2792 [Cymbomonas tetramitiformis]